MGHDWIIHVLTDLRRFAQLNEMPLLSEQLDEAMLVAVAEIASRDRRRLRPPVNGHPPQDTSPIK